MRLNNSLVVLTLAVAVWFAPMPSAMAGTITNHSAAICQPSSSMISLFYSSGGVESTGSGSWFVLCPLVRSTTRGAGANVTVDLNHSSLQATTCSFFSRSNTGALLGSATGSWSGTGIGRMTLSMVGAGKSSRLSDYSLLCYIAGNSSVRLMGIDLDEL